MATSSTPACTTHNAAGVKHSLHKCFAWLWRNLAPSIPIARKYYGLTAYFDFRDNAHYWLKSKRDLESYENVLPILNMFQGTVWDVGCNVGLLSLRAAQLGHPVYAFDISPKAIALLNRSSQRNRLNIVTIPQAFALNEYEYSAPNSSHTENKIDSPTTLKNTSLRNRSITYATAQQLYGTPALIKMDIEGYEEHFLTSPEFSAWLQSNKIAWLLELHHPLCASLLNKQLHPKPLGDNHYLLNATWHQPHI